MKKQNGEKLFINDAIAKCDKTMLYTAISLFVIGVLAVLEANYSQSFLGSKSVKQLVWTFFGIFTAFVFTLINYKKFAAEKMLKTLLIIFIFLLILLASASILGQNLKIGFIEIRKINGAYRWFDLGLFNFQPSVFVKVILILFAALKLSQISNDERKTKKIKVFANPEYGYEDLPQKTAKNIFNIFKNELFIFPLIILICIYKQPSNSILISISVVLLAMFALKNTKFIWLTIFLILLIAAVWNISPYFSKRFGGDNYQNEQAVLAISSGGWTGLGIGQGEHKYPGRLPEVENDFIFSLIAQETGFLFSIAFLIVYAIFITRGFIVALNTQDDFGKLAAFGITINYAFSFLVHLFVNLGFINTGASLPFVSYGGTAIIADAAMLGILLNISSANKKYERLRE